MKTKTLLPLFLASLMLLGGCGTENTPVVGNDTEAGNHDFQTGNEESTPTDTEEIAEPDSLEAEVLVGDWRMYYPSVYADVMWLSFNKDGTFTAELDPMPELWAGGDADDTDHIHYKGHLVQVSVGDAEAAFGVSLILDETDDPLYEAGETLGEFGIREVTYCDGERVVALDPLSLEDDDVFTTYFYSYGTNYLLQKDERELSARRHENDSFYGIVWKNRYGDSEEETDFGAGEFVIYVDDVDYADDHSITNEIAECVPYIVRNDTTGLLSGGPDGFFTCGESLWLFSTNEAGEIIGVEYVPTNEVPSEQAVLDILNDYDEYRMMRDDGMTVLFDGEGVVWSWNARLVWLGTDHEDQFTREVLYGVVAPGDVYRYSAVEDNWYWLDPGAMG